MVKTRYKVDLPAQMAECEANYHRLLKLMPQHLTTNDWQFAISGASRNHYLQIRIIERSRYTTTVQMAQLDIRLPEPTLWFQLPKLTVRLYHDARLAEVLAWEGHKRLRPRYEYPNAAMYQSDEKFQLNCFLGEWLSLSLQHGHSTDHFAAHIAR
jgi:uncharacterized protein YqiB (DUF1249 family)